MKYVTTEKERKNINHKLGIKNPMEMKEQFCF